MATTKQFNTYNLANSIDATNDLLLIYNNTSGTLQNISRNTYLALASAPLGLTDTQTVSNKTINNTNAITIKDGSFTIQNTSDVTKQVTFTLGNQTTATSRQFTFPTVSDTLVGISATQTLTAKTLTAPTISGGTISNTAISADTIQGFTTSSSGNIYGIAITSGAITASSAIGNGIILPSALVTGSGTSWVWQSYTPTFTNFTIGNGTVTTRYTQIGKTIHFRGEITLGSTSSMGTAPTVSLPVATSATGYSSNSGNSNDTLGVGTYNRNSVSAYPVSYAWATTTTVIMLAELASGTYVSWTNVTATVPNTWATADLFTWNITYEAA